MCSNVASAAYYTASMFYVLPYIVYSSRVRCCSMQFTCFVLLPFEFCSMFKRDYRYFLSSLRNNAQYALFLTTFKFCIFFYISASAYILSLCPPHVYGTYALYAQQRDQNCMCCSSWLQYRICHSLSTIQYVLVPQVQRQLQSACLCTSKSRSS